MSAWTKVISIEEADDVLSEAMRVARTPHGTIDNVMRVRLFRPNTMHVSAATRCLWMRR